MAASFCNQIFTLPFFSFFASEHFANKEIQWSVLTRHTIVNYSYGILLAPFTIKTKHLWKLHRGARYFYYFLSHIRSISCPMIVGGKISSLSSPHENRPSRSVPEGPERAEKKGRFSSWSTLNSNWIFQSYHCYYVPSGLFHHVWPNSDCKRWKIELERA